MRAHRNLSLIVVSHQRGALQKYCVPAIARSSIRLEQAPFQDGRHVASDESVIVHVDADDRKSRPLPAASVAVLEACKGR